MCVVVVRISVYIYESWQLQSRLELIHTGRVMLTIEYWNVMRRVPEYECSFDGHIYKGQMRKFSLNWIENSNWFWTLLNINLLLLCGEFYISHKSQNSKSLFGSTIEILQIFIYKNPSKNHAVSLKIPYLIHHAHGMVFLLLILALIARDCFDPRDDYELLPVLLHLMT